MQDNTFEQISNIQSNNSKNIFNRMDTSKCSTNCCIIGLTGNMGSGKSTVAKILEKEGFIELCFANTLKDIVSVAFDWPRDLLQGDTKESREWRERVDAWWATKLKIPNLTPRWVLQYWGTEVIRDHFNKIFWITALERKIYNLASKGYNKIVISDCRFPNEIEFIEYLGRNGYFSYIFELIRDDKLNTKSLTPSHSSEQKLNVNNSIIIENDGTMEELETNILDKYGEMEAIRVNLIDAKRDVWGYKYFSYCPSLVPTLYFIAKFDDLINKIMLKYKIPRYYAIELFKERRREYISKTHIWSCNIPNCNMAKEIENHLPSNDLFLDDIL